MERERILHAFIEQQVCVSDMNFFDMVKTIRTAEIDSNIKIDPRTVSRILDKMDREGRILIDRQTIFMDNDDDEENAKCEATFYMSVDCTQGKLICHSSFITFPVLFKDFQENVFIGFFSNRNISNIGKLPQIGKINKSGKSPSLRRFGKVPRIRDNFLKTRK